MAPMRGIAWLMLTGTLCLLSASARAQEAVPSGGVSPYEQRIERGLEEFERGNWAEARAYFIKAHRQLPSARTARGLGIIAFEMRRYVESVKWLRQALTLEANPLTAAQRAEVQRTLALSDDFVGRYQILLDPEDAELRVDGERVELPDDGVLWLDVGEYKVTASAPGFRTESMELLVEGGEQRPLTFKLVRPAAAGALGGSAARDDDSIFSTWWFWTSAAVIVGGATAAVFVRTNQEDDVQPLIPGDDGVTVRALTVAP